MYSIEIDFDVYKDLTNLRDSEDVTYNDVIRELLGLNKSNIKQDSESSVTHQQYWVTKGVSFPVGTEFRAKYKGQTFSARVEAEGLLFDGRNFDTPSSAAIAITNNSVNGWKFWECKFPGKTTWQSISSLRESN